MVSAETQAKAVKGGLAGGAGVAVAASLLFITMQGGGHSGNAAPSTTTSHSASAEAHHTKAVVAPTTAKALGGVTVFGVEWHDSYAGTTLEVCTPDGNDGGALITSLSQAKQANIGELSGMMPTTTAGRTQCEIDFDNMYSNTSLDGQVSNKVGAIFKLTLEGDGSSGNVIALQQMTAPGIVH